MPKISTFRLLDLEGKLLDKNHAYDTSYLLKILKSMIFVDEMDNVLLKVKSQGKVAYIQEKFPFTWPPLENMPVSSELQQLSLTKTSSILSIENKELIFGEGIPLKTLLTNALEI